MERHLFLRHARSLFGVTHGTIDLPNMLQGTVAMLKTTLVAKQNLCPICSSNVGPLPRATVASPTRVRGGTLNSPTKAAELGTPCKHKGDALEGRQRPANSGRLLWAAKDAHQPHAKGLGLNTFRSLSTGCLTSPHAHTKLSEQIERINICTIYLSYTYIMYNMCIYIYIIYISLKNVCLNPQNPSASLRGRLGQARPKTVIQRHHHFGNLPSTIPIQSSPCHIYQTHFQKHKFRHEYPNTL